MASECPVSVIMGSYNSRATIDAAIQSVLAQTHQDWELVICDDGSTDGSGDRILEAAERDPRIQIVSSPVNRGLAAARNLALTHAHGTNVALFDADDALEPTYLEVMLAYLDLAPPNTGIACCDAWLVDATGHTLGRFSHRSGSAAHLDLPTLLRANRIFVSAVCPRCVLDAVGGFEPGLRSAEDYDLWIRIMELGYGVVYVDAPLVRYRVGVGSLSSDRLGMATADRLVFERALARGNLELREREIAEARRDIAAAAETWARGPRLAAVGPLLRAARARVKLATA